MVTVSVQLRKIYAKKHHFQTKQRGNLLQNNMLTHNPQNTFVVTSLNDMYQDKEVKQNTQILMLFRKGMYKIKSGNIG